MTARRRRSTTKQAENYKHPTADSALRPDVGVQPQFKKTRPPKKYRYDSSLPPELNWDGQNPARELGEWLIAMIEEASQLDPPHKFPNRREFKLNDGSVMATVTGLQDAVDQLKALSKPFLNWAGKAERLSFDVPTLPLFVHERLSTKAILETLKGHRRDKGFKQFTMEFFGDQQHAISDQILRAYEHRDNWVNRMILGDSLVVMNSLLEYEGLGGQVQMIYMDPPYGIKFGSNFQPFVRKRDVTHNDDESISREPEMVKAYRDTWELGLHSYLAYMRDRLLVARELLHPSGSIFVQISDENVHLVRSVLDEVFGTENFVSLITYKVSSGTQQKVGPRRISDYIIWYARDVVTTKFRRLYLAKAFGGDSTFTSVELKDGTRRSMTEAEIGNPDLIPCGSRPFRTLPLHSQGSGDNEMREFAGKKWSIPNGAHWRYSRDGFERLVDSGRILPGKTVLEALYYFDDFPISEITATWADTAPETNKSYVVQTSMSPIQRCMFMTTDPGDLVLDPTCGSGTTAYVAERWGRRWITIDVSRVPLALARQRLLTATSPYYDLREPQRGPAGGFVYKRKQNTRGEEAGGIVPHITLESIANDQPPKDEVLVDNPEVDRAITRVSGPFVVEATIPTPAGWVSDSELQAEEGVQERDHQSFVDRMLQVLRRSPVVHVAGGKAVTLKNLRPPAKSLSLSAEALVENGLSRGEEARAKEQPVAILFGPENAGVNQKAVWNAAKEASAKGFGHLFVIGFAVSPDARELIDECEEAMGIPATYVAATTDLTMGDLLKNMRSSQIFSVCGLPDVKLKRLANGQFQVELLGLDTFDPGTMETQHLKGDDVPAWFLDTDYNGLCFHVCQAFFPRTGAWDSLKRQLKGEYADSVWEHLAGATSEAFEPGENDEAAVKVIDDRGNELLVVKRLNEAVEG